MDHDTLPARAVEALIYTLAVLAGVGLVGLILGALATAVGAVAGMETVFPLAAGGFVTTVYAVIFYLLG